MLIKVLIFSILFANNVFAAEFGKAILSGQGCRTQDVKLVEGKNSVPLDFVIVKKYNQSLLRKTCNLRMPVKLGKNEKIQLREVAVDLESKVAKGMITSGEASLHTGFVHIKEFSHTVVGLHGNVKKVLKSNTVESKCGQDTMLAINLSLNASGKEEITLSSGDLNFEIKVVSCN